MMINQFMYINNFDRFMFHKTRNKNKKWFFKICLQCFSNENKLIKHKEDCLSIHGKQSVKLEEGIIEFWKLLKIVWKLFENVFNCYL